MSNPGYSNFSVKDEDKKRAHKIMKLRRLKSHRLTFAYLVKLYELCNSKIRDEAQMRIAMEEIRT